MRNHVPPTHRGITLMEVLISIGILAVGLTSVMSLIPAGKSEVSRALVYDRASALAANALADAATFGLLKIDSLAGVSPNDSAIVFDPALSPFPVAQVSQSGPRTALGRLRPGGIGATGSSAEFASATAAPIMLRMLAQGRDDLVYASPPDDDSPPRNQFPADMPMPGPRSFMGRMSCLLAVTGTNQSAVPSSGSIARLSVVVFHNRDLSAGADEAVRGLWDGSALSEIVPPAGRTLRDIVTPGTVVYSPGNRTFHQLAMAAIDSATNSAAFVTFSGSEPVRTTNNPIPVLLLLDSVGLAEQTVVLEGPGPWSQIQ